MKKTLLAALILTATMGGQSWAQPTIYEAVQQLSKNQLDIYDACMGGAVEFGRNAQDCLRIARSMSLDQLKAADQKKPPQPAAGGVGDPWAHLPDATPEQIAAVRDNRSNGGERGPWELYRYQAQASEAGPWQFPAPPKGYKIDNEAYLRSLPDDQLKALAASNGIVASKGFDAFPDAKQDDLKADLKYWLSHLNMEALQMAGAFGFMVVLMVLARNYFSAIKTRDGRPLFDRSGLLIKAVWNLLIGLMYVLFVIACFVANPLIGLLVVPVPFIRRRKAAA